MKMMFNVLADFTNDDKLEFINRCFKCFDLWCQVEVNNRRKFWLLIVKNAKELEFYKKCLPKKIKVWDYIDTCEKSKSWLYVWIWNWEVEIHTFKKI